MKKKISNIFLMLLFTNLCVAQTSYVPGNPIIRNFLPEEYGAFYQNWDIIQDNRGVIYVANVSGLLEYDGTNWKLFENKNKSACFSVANDNAGLIYVGGVDEFGYLGFNKKGEKEYFSLTDKIPDKQKDFSTIWSITITSKGVYFAAQNKIFRYYKNNQILFASRKNGLYINNYHFIAIADCTGHGIPGAFMSMIGSRLLNEIIVEHKIYSPKIILTELNLRIQKALRQEQTSVPGGMDVCLCRIERAEQTKILFTGAKRDLIYYEQKKKNLVFIKGDRKSTGGIVGARNKSEFSENELIIEKGDVIYLTTDGYTDQNNIKRKRFGSKEFKRILSENAEKALSKQKDILENALKDWQKDAKQRDDITVIGIKI